MGQPKKLHGIVGGVGLLGVLAIYLCGVAVWSPLFLIWPQRIPGLTFPQTVMVRWDLVRMVWRSVLGWFR